MRALLFGLLVAHACAQPSGLLRRVRERVRDALARVPNYTCSESVTRETLRGTPPELTALDRVRLDITVIDGSEMFSWPGTARFEKHDPAEVVPGSITSGEYVSILKTVFDSDLVEYGTPVADQRDGRSLLRCDFAVTHPAYTLRCGPTEARLPYHGAFWMDQHSEGLAALEMVIDEIPPTHDCSDVRTLIDYGESLFPASAAVSAKYRRGGLVLRNRIVFSGCRKYSGESKIVFEEAASAAPAETAPPVLPAGVRFELTLDNPISLSASAGDTITATLVRPVRAGSLHIPAGARLTGRLIECSAFFAPPAAQIAFQFFELALGGERLKFRGRLASFDRIAGIRDNRPRTVRAADLRKLKTLDWRYSASFLLNGVTEIPAGFRMQWDTARP